jgi:hypothetical protein
MSERQLCHVGSERQDAIIGMHARSIWGTSGWMETEVRVYNLPRVHRAAATGGRRRARPLQVLRRGNGHSRRLCRDRARAGVARDVAPGEVGATALATGGWYTLVVNAAPDTAFEPCIIPAG